MNDLALDLERIPALRVVLTTNCNLRCRYCPPKGENFVNTKGPVTTKRLLSLLNIFYSIGFRQFGFTGGEPLLREDLSLILKESLKFKGVSLKLYTNGILLKDRIKDLENLDLIKLSLDSIDQNKYREITGRDKLKDILCGVRMLKENKIKVRVNVVLTKDNCGDIFELINFCHRETVDLKILDLNCFDMPGYSVWRDLYKSPSIISRRLAKIKLAKKIIYTKGNYGIPMNEFKWDGIAIRIKDTRKPAVYAPVCQGCGYFLCQEGLYQLTLTSDGRLKMCRHRPDISLNLNKETSDSKIRKGILRFLEENYFSTKRIYQKKQVFAGRFGARDNNETK